MTFPIYSVGEFIQSGLCLYVTQLPGSVKNLKTETDSVLNVLRFALFVIQPALFDRSSGS